MKSKQCEYCGKELAAYSEEQLQYMYTQHLFAKHPEKVKILVDGKFRTLGRPKKKKQEKTNE